MSYIDQIKVEASESKLDLDSESFVTKRIGRCSDCGDIYYTGISSSHLCENKKSKTSMPVVSRSPDMQSYEKDRLSTLLDFKPVVEKLWFHDEIYSIWKKKNFPRHEKQSIMEIKGMEKRSNEGKDIKDEFSFSPYDNFF